MSRTVDPETIDIQIPDEQDAIKSIMKYIEEKDNKIFNDALNDYKSYGFENYLTEQLKTYKEFMNIDPNYESIIDKKFQATLDYSGIVNDYKSYRFDNYLTEQLKTYEEFMNIDTKYESIIDKKFQATLDFNSIVNDYKSYGFENYLTEQLKTYEEFMNIDPKYESIIDKKFIKKIDYEAIKKIYKEYNDVDYYKQYNTYKQYMNIDVKYGYYLGNVARFLPRINYQKGSEYFKNGFSKITNNLKLPNFSQYSQVDNTDWRKDNEYKIVINEL